MGDTKLSFGNILFEAIRVTIILLTHKTPLYRILNQDTPATKKKVLIDPAASFWGSDWSMRKPDLRTSAKG
jgi:hypothetical protein